MFVRVWAGERDLVTILVSTISFLMYIYVVMDYVAIRVLNLNSILSSNGCNFHTDFDLLSLFLFICCVGTGGLCDRPENVSSHDPKNTKKPLETTATRPASQNI